MMYILSTYILIIIVAVITPQLLAVDSISAGVAVGFSAVSSVVIGAFEQIKCHFYECCNTNWLTLDTKALKTELELKLHGQHLALEAITKSLNAHVKDKNPQKALVLSLHGWTGTGKNFVSNIIAKHLFKKGSDSSYSHQFLASHHFSNPDYLPYYKHQLKEWIYHNVSRCGHSLFIFDEMDKMSPELIDVIKPYIDFYSHVDHVDFRNSIFIFLSNSAGTDIAYEALKVFRAGGKREDINLSKLQSVVTQAAYNEQGALWHSRLIEHHLIDLFVPFLPLERRHVRLCIKDQLRWILRHDLVNDDAFISSVLDKLHYFPDGEQVYSDSGCKRIGQIINVLVDEIDDNTKHIEL